MLRGFQFFALVLGAVLAGVPAAHAQTVEYGASKVERTQTYLEGKVERKFTPDKDPVFEAERKAVYKSGEGFREVAVEKAPPQKVTVGATFAGEKVEAEVSVIQVKGPAGLQADVLGAGASAEYVAGIEGKNIKAGGSAGANAYLLRLKAGGKKQIGDDANNLTGVLEGKGMVGADANANGRVFAGVDGVGVEVGGDAFAGAKVDGTLALKAMICKIGAGAGVTGELSAGAGVSVGAGLTVDWAKLEVTVGAKLAATLGLGAGAKGNVTISLEGLFDPGELARCLGKKAKAVHAAGVEGTRILIQPAFNRYYIDQRVVRNIERLEARNREFERKRQQARRAELDLFEAARAKVRNRALMLVEPFSLADFPILYWDGRLIPNEVYYQYAREAVNTRNLTLMEAGFSPTALGITPFHYGVNMELGDDTRYRPNVDLLDFTRPPGFQRSNMDILNIGPTRLRNHYPH